MKDPEKMLLTQNFVEFTRKKVMKVRRRGGFSLSLYLELPFDCYTSEGEGCCLCLAEGFYGNVKK
jgi:hypothetical protein